MTMARSIKYGKVNISKPHFLISYSEELGCKDWFPVAILTATNTDEMVLGLLVHDIKYMPVVEMVKREVEFYLFELKNHDPVGYLCYHCSTMANIYSNVHFTYVPEINNKNILYYIEKSSILLGTYMVQQVSNMQEVYMKCLVDHLFSEVLHENTQNDAVRNYNQDLYFIYDLLFIHLPKQNGFEVAEPPSIIEFSMSLSSMEVLDYCNMINYLRKLKLLKLKDVKRMLTFHYINKKLHQDIKSCLQC